jgi:hypothetical protein
VGPSYGRLPRPSNPEQPSQHVDLDDADHGAALVAPQFDILALHGRHDAAAAIAAGDTFSSRTWTCSGKPPT